LGDSAIEVPDAAMGTVTRAANVQLKKKRVSAWPSLACD
jgi:hypothetical protein